MELLYSFIALRGISKWERLVSLTRIRIDKQFQFPSRALNHLDILDDLVIALVPHIYTATANKQLLTQSCLVDGGVN